jgi:hypothetical protein
MPDELDDSVSVSIEWFSDFGFEKVHTHLIKVETPNNSIGSTPKSSSSLLRDSTVPQDT